MTEPGRIKITSAQLAAMSAAEARSRRMAEQAWEAAFRAPPPAPAFRSERERTLRSLALGLAAACAFMPAALLSDGGGEVVEPRLALRNVVAVLVLTLLPAWLSAREETSPEAEDAPRARLAKRFSPLLVGLLLALSLVFPYLIWWKALEAVLLSQAPFALFLHVPRVRAIQVLVTGWAALASAVLDDRAAWVLAPVFALIVLACALDRALDVRTAGPAYLQASSAERGRLAIPFTAAAAISALGALAYVAAWALLPPLERVFPLPYETTPRPVRAPTEVPILELFLVVLSLPLVWGLYHLLMERLRSKEAQLPPEETPVVRPLATEALAVSEPAIVTSWPEGPRLRIVRRYLEHLRALARLGVRRAPGDAPLDVARAVSTRAPGASESESRLARAFHEARYSPFATGEDAATRAAADADAVEGELGKRARS